MQTMTYAGHGAGTEKPRRSLRERIATLLKRLARARRARRDLETLRNANEQILADIGLTRVQIEAALDAPFWINPSDRILASRKPHRR